MTMPGGRWKASLTRIDMGGHAPDGQQIEVKKVIWNSIPAFISIKKTSEVESPTGINSQTQYVVVLPYLPYEKEPLPNDTLTVNGLSLRVLWVEQDQFKRHLRIHAERHYPAYE
jgi:hypothetical protein